MYAQEEFTLPGGLLDSKGACYRQGRLRALTGADEEWIYSLPTSRMQAPFVTELLARCIHSIGTERVTKDLLRQLTSGDRDYLLLKLRQASFGDLVSLVLICPREACGAKMDLDINIEQIPVEARELRTSYRLRLGEPGSLEIEYRVPCGGDEEKLLLSVSPDRTTLRNQLLAACVVGIGSESSRNSNDELSESIKQALIDAIEEVAPRVETEIEVPCPECNQRFTFELDPVQLLLEEVGRGRRNFEREIHLLALHYHWPLRELLGLTRPQRQRYLRLLIDELDARGADR
jgi:hypothetical protein